MAGPNEDADELPELPELDVEDGPEGIEDPAALDLSLPAEGDTSLGDAQADDLQLDPRALGGAVDEPSALGDDAQGIEDAPVAADLHIDERRASLLERGAGELGSAEDDDQIGIEPLPADSERTDAEGLDDPVAERLEEKELPVLDVGNDEDEVDVGIDLPASADVEPSSEADDDERRPQP